MADTYSTVSNPRQKDAGFLEYWESMGLFENFQFVLPPQFMILFEIARNIFTEDTTLDALGAIEEMTKQERILDRDRDESIQINREERLSPLSDKMELDNYRRLVELRNILPRELGQDDHVFDIKLFTKTLIVQKFYESEADTFRPISTTTDEQGQDASRFEQKFYLLLDRSRSMDVKMRSFYSKCIVAEFLRRKLNTKAKLYYRPFDSKAGKLFRLEKKEDFPRLMEEVLLTTTGGKSTNLQQAIYQAISDIKYDKEMINTEILVVTDGISKVDKYEMKERLGDIKLNVLKIGSELAEANFYDVKSTLDEHGSPVDPTYLNMKSVKYEIDKFKNDREHSSLTAADERSYRLLLEFSDGITKDLQEISHKYIEIQDFDKEGLFEITDENMESIRDNVRSLSSANLSTLEIHEKERLYKQLYLFCQYIEMLAQHNESKKGELNSCLSDLIKRKQALFRDPELLFTILEVDKFDEDKKELKLAKKDVKQLMKDMKLSSKNMSVNEMKKAQLMFTKNIAGGEGGSGQIFLLLLIKLFQFLKKIILLPFRPFTKNNENREKKEE